MRTQSTLAFHTLREEFVKEKQKKRETILKVDDLPIFMMFEKHNKTYRNVAVRTDAYVA